jgi:alpha-galactosidase
MNALFYSLLLLPFAGAAAPQTWTLANGQVARTVSFTPESGLVTQQLSDLATHTDFIPANQRPAAEFSFQANGHSYRGASSAFTLVDAGESPLPNGKSLTIRLRAKDLPLEISVVYIVYNGHPAIRKHLEFRNTGDATLTLSHLNLEALTPSLGPANEITLHTQYGAIPRESFYTGRSEDAGLLLANGRTGIGIAILSEVPGYMKRTEIDAWAGPDTARIGVLYDTDLMPFERSLAPGEEFRTAGVSLLTFRNGDGFRDPHWVLPTYTSQILMRRGANQGGAPWIYNTWVPFMRRIDGQTVLPLIDAAAQMGVDIFTIDDGWQDDYGSNAVNLAAFPGGLKPIQELLEAKGMRLGLWIPLAAIGTGTADYREHPEWAALDQEGKPKITDTAAGPKVVMCLASPFRDAAADRVNRAIDQFHLAYVKLDLTTIFNAYGEAPGCWSTAHAHRNWSESLNRIYEGISYATARIYQKHPDVLLDLTFELWGQKHVIDAGLLAAGDLDWLSNVDDRQPHSAGPLQARTLLYQRAISMPAESMLVGNLEADMPSVQEVFATAIGSAPLLLGDLRKLSPADRQWYHEKIAWFKQLRNTTAIGESFFPLGDWLAPSPSEWDGFARLSRGGKGMIAIFRNQSIRGDAGIQLALIPEGNYEVRSILTNRVLGVFGKPDWARGVSVPFPEGAPVEILQLTPAK